MFNKHGYITLCLKPAFRLLATYVAWNTMKNVLPTAAAKFKSFRWEAELGLSSCQRKVASHLLSRECMTHNNSSFEGPKSALLTRKGHGRSTDSLEALSFVSILIAILFLPTCHVRFPTIPPSQRNTTASRSRSRDRTHNTMVRAVRNRV